MRMYECHVCSGLCDPGELENGVCFECRSEDVERQESRNFEIRKSLNQMIQERIKEQKGGQMVMRVM